MEILLFLAAILLCYSNGANDNFKGFATVWGSGAADFDTAKLFATIATIAGAITALYIANDLVASFSGRGLVPNELAGTTSFVFSVALGAGLTVLLATFLGFPISTTHAIIGGLVGAGLAAGLGSGVASVNFTKLGQTFLLPLLLSPLISALSALSLFFVFRKLFTRNPRANAVVSVDAGACICEPPAQMNGAGSAVMTNSIAMPMINSSLACAEVGAVPIVTVTKRGMLDKLHYASAASICFARGVNDTPKLVALLLAAKTIGLTASFWMVALAMAIGGWLNARKVATTMSKKLVPLNEAQGFTANIVTATLVIFASKLGLPVSTTHVSVGSISGVGFATGNVETRELTKIVLSWVITLPCAATIAAVAMFIVR
jgi:inorganic phosphate transporter, PiT family